MRLWDLSHPLDSSTQIYPGDPSFHCTQSASIPKDGYNVSSLSPVKRRPTIHLLLYRGSVNLL